MKIELKKWTPYDKERLAYICSNVDRSYLRNRLPNPYTVDCAVDYINFINSVEGVSGVFRAIVVDGEYVGNISVEGKDDVYIKDGEIGYMLLSSHWSKGITKEAVAQICAIAFEELDIVRITGMVDIRNIASRKVLEHNGFELEGVMKNALFKNGVLSDQCIYGKLK